MQRYLISYLMLLILPGFLEGQSIQGFVYDRSDSLAIQGVHITVPGSFEGTVSDDRGYFELTLSSWPDFLEVSHVSYSHYIFKDQISESNPIQIYLASAEVPLNNQVVVTANRAQSGSFESPDAITVLTQYDLRLSAPRSTAEALIGCAGVWMQKTNHGGGSPFVRGLTGNQTLLLVDGIRLNNATFRYGPNQYFNTLDVFSLDRIEVVRGKGSVLYGSDALGGVINVVNRSPKLNFNNEKQFKFRGRLNYMNRDMEYAGYGEVEYGSNNFAFLGNLGYKRFGDLYAGGDLGYLTPSGYDESSGNVQMKLNLGKEWFLKGAYQYVQQIDVPRYDQVAQRGYARYSFDPQIHQLSFVRLEHFGKQAWLQKVCWTLSHQRSEEKRKTQRNGNALVTTEQDVVNTWGINLDVHSVISNRWTAISGLEMYLDRVQSEKRFSNESTVYRGLYPNHSRMFNSALFSQHTIKVKDWRFQWGARWNLFQIQSNDEEFGSIELSPQAFVGNMAIQYYTSPKDHIILSLHSAFRAPNINDISSFGLFDFGIEIPAPQLRPEQSRTYEIGYKHSGENWSIGLAAYTMRINNQIVRVAATYRGEAYLDEEKVYQKQNLSQSNISGLELETGWQWTNNLTMTGHLTWTYGVDLGDGGPMRRIPPLNGRLGIQYEKNRLNSGVHFLFATKQDRLSGGDIDDHRIPEGGTPGWQILNLQGGYRFDHYSIQGGIQNLLNLAYRMHGSGVDGYGRSVWLQLTVEI